MRIGIDIDDTITETWKYMIPTFNKIFDIPIDKLKKSNPYYYSLDNKITIEEYFKTIKTFYNKMITDVPIKVGAKKYINKLYNDKHEIILITSRTNKEIENPYETTYNYLKSHNIKFTKLIINGRRKETICQNEQIDLFIDDSVKHCQNVKKIGIDVLMFNTIYNKNTPNIHHVKTWKEIYENIQRR